MKTSTKTPAILRTLQNYEPFGIVPLTGESDPFMFRMLFDLTERGKRIVCSAFGLPEDATFCEPWNSGSKDDPHVASMLINSMSMPQIGVMCMIDSGFQVIAVSKSGLVIGASTDDVGYTNDGKLGVTSKVPYLPVVSLESMLGEPIAYMVRANGYQATSRNTHTMSGRLA